MGEMLIQMVQVGCGCWNRERRRTRCAVIKQSQEDQIYKCNNISGLSFFAFSYFILSRSLFLNFFFSSFLEWQSGT